eukprot:7522509-Pyramimonas_sp.AAC.1
MRPLAAPCSERSKATVRFKVFRCDQATSSLALYKVPCFGLYNLQNIVRDGSAVDTECEWSSRSI